MHCWALSGCFLAALPVGSVDAWARPSRLSQPDAEHHDTYGCILQLTQATTSKLHMPATTKPPKLNEPSKGNGKPLVERKPNEIEPSALSLALERRIRQQEILAELGVSALQGASFSKLLDDTVRLTADGMRAEFCKVLE